MNESKNELVPVVLGIVLSVVLLVLTIIFYSFVNMYVWNNVLLYFVELPLITLAGGFGIGILKDAFLKQTVKRDKDMSSYDYMLYSVLYRATILLMAWIFTLLI